MRIFKLYKHTLNDNVLAQVCILCNDIYMKINNRAHNEVQLFWSRYHSNNETSYSMAEIEKNNNKTKQKLNLNTFFVRQTGTSSNINANETV